MAFTILSASWICIIFSDLVVEFYHVKHHSGGEAVRGVVGAHGDGREVQLTQLHPLDGAGGGIPVPGPEQAVIYL